MLGLDGYEASLAEAMIAEGELPVLRDLVQRSATVALDHGAAKRTGLAWEHVASGRSPAAAGHWAAVHFDPQRYAVWQETTGQTPFPAALACRTVVFDPPYFNLERAPAVQGLVGWGAHDPGVAAGSRPAGLDEELLARFGPYPADEWIYGFVWPSTERTQAMGQALARATELRGRAIEWLLGERLPDWDLALAVVSEPHSAAEALWHGIDPGHRLHGAPSAAAAREGIRAVYRALDGLLARLVRRFPEVTLVVFAMHGMGANDSDLASMLLLPELLYREAFGRGLLPSVPRWLAGDHPDLPPAEHYWEGAVRRQFPVPVDSADRLRRTWQRLFPPPAEPAGTARRLPLDWMPAAWYRPHWKAMPAFALPSFYDGRVRINLAGRERRGRVRRQDYGAALDAIERLLGECRDWRSGEPVARAIERTGGADPAGLGASEADLVVLWNGSSLGFRHPRHGLIGPAPQRRTGGHTGSAGIAHLFGAGLPAGHGGVASAFDVVPTVLELLGEAAPQGLTGGSLLPRLRSGMTADAPLAGALQSGAER